MMDSIAAKQYVEQRAKEMKQDGNDYFHTVNTILTELRRDYRFICMINGGPVQAITSSPEGGVNYVIG